MEQNNSKMKENVTLYNEKQFKNNTIRMLEY